MAQIVTAGLHASPFIQTPQETYGDTYARTTPIVDTTRPIAPLMWHDIQSKESKIGQRHVKTIQPSQITSN